jgi:uncharacterized glyoxalase superfamily protein PhnB
MQVEPYLFFDGRCEEAIEFYKSKLGAEVTMLMRFKDSPEPPMVPPGASAWAIRPCWRPTAAARETRASRVFHCR